MSQNQGNEGDEKKKEKSSMTWHEIVWDGSVKKKDSKVQCTTSRGWGGAGEHVI